MTDLTKLTAEELLASAWVKPVGGETAEILRRLERLEQCEALIKKFAAITDEDCSCLPAFKERGLVDPACSYHDYKWAIDAARAALEAK